MTTKKYIVHLVKKDDYDGCIDFIEAYNIKDCKNKVKEYYNNEWMIEDIAEIKNAIEEEA